MDDLDTLYNKHRNVLCIALIPPQGLTEMSLSWVQPNKYRKTVQCRITYSVKSTLPADVKGPLFPDTIKAST